MNMKPSTTVEMFEIVIRKTPYSQIEGILLQRPFLDRYIKYMKKPIVANILTISFGSYITYVFIKVTNNFGQLYINSNVKQKLASLLNNYIVMKIKNCGCVD